MFSKTKYLKSLNNKSKLNCQEICFEKHVDDNIEKLKLIIKVSGGLGLKKIWTWWFVML